MGLHLVNYQYIDDANLDVLRSSCEFDDEEEAFETIEDLNEESRNFP